MADQSFIITLESLLNNLVSAQQRMSRKNPHRLLLRQCEQALIQLAYRVGEQTEAKGPEHAPTEALPVGREALR